MKLRKKYIVLSLLLVLMLGCGKQKKVINSKDDSEISEVDMVNKNIKTEDNHEKFLSLRSPYEHNAWFWAGLWKPQLPKQRSK